MASSDPSSDAATSPASSYVTELVRPSHQAALAALFERCDSPCYCRYLHFPEDNNAWLARCASSPATNQRELASALSEQRPDGHGLVAFHDGLLVGWLKITPALAIPKAYDRKPYKKLPCFEGNREGTWLLGCSLVDPGHRKRALYGRMVDEAITWARGAGVRALEALPRNPSAPVPDEELWTGAASTLSRRGFVAQTDLEAYPVLRLDLG